MIGDGSERAEKARMERRRLAMAKAALPRIPGRDASPSPAAHKAATVSGDLGSKNVTLPARRDAGSSVKNDSCQADR
jgi:hypothetical protein